jgi:hypothetical protein
MRRRQEVPSPAQRPAAQRRRNLPRQPWALASGQTLPFRVAKQSSDMYAP